MRESREASQLIHLILRVVQAELADQPVGLEAVVVAVAEQHRLQLHKMVATVALEALVV